jgi:hypothetical protein
MFEAVYSCVLPLGILKGCNQAAVVNGFFRFAINNRQGALADGLHGLNPRNTDNRTHPLICRTALVERLLKDWVQRWKQGPIYKRINPTLALGQCLLIKMNHDECRTRQTLERAG